MGVSILSEAAIGGVLLKGVLKNFTKFTGKHLRQSLFKNVCVRIRGLQCVERDATFLKKRLCYRWFPVNFANFFKNIFFTEYIRATASALCYSYCYLLYRFHQIITLSIRNDFFWTCAWLSFYSDCLLILGEPA